MIHIEKDQIVPENKDLRVFSQSGDYNDNDLIECYHIDNPDFALSAFSATFIKYGGIVYQFGDPLLMGEELLKIDPECTHDFAILFKEEEERKKKRERGDFTPDNPVPADENISSLMQEEKVIQSEDIEKEPKVEDLNSDKKVTEVITTEEDENGNIIKETITTTTESVPETLDVPIIDNNIDEVLPSVQESTIPPAVESGQDQVPVVSSIRIKRRIRI